MQEQIDHKKVREFGGIEFLAKQVVTGFITGLHKSPLHGFSVEFAEHRLYNPGESTRHIDWKLYGKTEKLFTKRYEEETNLRCHIVIDNSSSMYFPKDEVNNKISFSVYCAAALIQLLRKQRDAVGLTVFADEVELHTKAKSSSIHHKFLYDELEKLLKFPSQAKNTSAIAALHQIAESIPKRSLVVLFSDMFDNRVEDNEELFGALQHLKHNKHEVLLFHTTDKSKELDFEFEKRPYTFIDLETNQEIKLHPNEVKETYLKSVSEFTKELKIKCNQYKIDYIEADINGGFDVVLKSYLIKRQKLL